MKRLLLSSLFIAVIGSIFSVLSSAVIAADIGVVFMHGKWGAPDNKVVESVVSAMKRAGYLVEAPEMPWSRSRAYDRDVAGALAEIDTAVQRLKDRGAQRIVVGGQSLGANTAMIYASQRDGIAGVLAVSPGHTPEQQGYQQSLKGDVERARKLIADGKGNARDYFYDNNQGKDQKMPATAAIYFSWFDPNGLAAMPKSAAAIKSGTAILWMVGAEDAMSKRGEGYAYARVPANPKSAYKMVQGGHFDAGDKAAGEVVAWLKQL